MLQCISIVNLDGSTNSMFIRELDSDLNIQLNSYYNNDGLASSLFQIEDNLYVNSIERLYNTVEETHNLYNIVEVVDYKYEDSGLDYLCAFDNVFELNKFFELNYFAMAADCHSVNHQVYACDGTNKWEPFYSYFNKHVFID